MPTPDRLEDIPMTAAPVRNLLFGALLLVCAWVPAATLAAPHGHAAAQTTVEAPETDDGGAVLNVEQASAARCDTELRVRRS